MISLTTLIWIAGAIVALLLARTARCEQGGEFTSEQNGMCIKRAVPESMIIHLRRAAELATRRR